MLKLVYFNNNSDFVITTPRQQYLKKNEIACLQIAINKTTIMLSIFLLQLASILFNKKPYNSNTAPTIFIFKATMRFAYIFLKKQSIKVKKCPKPGQ